MDWSENKYELSFAVILASMLTAGVWLFGHFTSNTPLSKVEAEEIRYEMPRPKSLLVSLFDLVGREIERQLINPFKDKEEAANRKPVAANIAAATPAKNPAAEAKKKADAKKVEEEKKRNAITARIIEEAHAKKLAMDGPTSQVNVGNSAGSQYIPNVNNEASPANSVKDETADKLSPAQWRSLISAQPTMDNVQKLVAAYLEKQIDSKSFYLIINDLTKNHNKETQAVAIMALKMTPSYLSFATLVSLQGQLDSSLEVSLQQSLLSYTQASQINYLGQALQSKEVTVALKAFSLTQVAIQSAKVSINGQDPNSKDPQIQSALANWKALQALTPILKNLSKGSDSQIVQYANSILAEFQNT